MASESRTKRILVIDDEYAIRVLLKSFLEGHGYEVRLAENGENALRTFEEFRPEVVISDIMMPVESGLSIVSRIRDRNPSISVVYLSAWLDETDTEKRLYEELNRYPEYKLIKKPFDLDVLLKAIEELSSSH
jgi:two-component system OmpR family response regulator